MAQEGQPPQQPGPAATMAGEEQLDLLMQELRSKATELFLREQWAQSLQVYSQLISLCQDRISSGALLRASDQDWLSKLQKSLCLALSNRAVARYRMRDLDEALRDCDEALGIENAHFKTLLCKGRILLELSRYAPALECFRLASLDPQAIANLEALSRLLERCRKLDLQSRTGNFDLSDWVLGGFRGELPELAEFVGAVEIKKSDLSGRGLFATKNIDTGTLLVVTKAIAIERGILLGEELGESKQLVMWKSFVNRVADSSSKCKRMSQLIGKLSSGEEDMGELEVPDIAIFRPEKEGDVTCSNHQETIEMGRILTILDVNSLVEDAISAKVLGRNRDYYGVGIWLLPSFINHSCCPNARRLHVGNHLIVHASRDIKVGEEITFPYFDVLAPLEMRRKMSGNWGFRCSCKRCKFEEEISSKQELKDLEIGLELGMDLGSLVYRLEEGMRRWGVRGKQKGYLRASLWGAYSGTYGSEKIMRRWGRRVPTPEVVVESVVEAAGGDERVVKVGVEQVKRSGGGGVVEMERVFKLGRGLYGKVMKKQALRALMEL
ncbi:uncharacterized protein LOC116199838 [Punica granatum]|uniref:SET domain-containing protein n=2 Tax=Punica granatum TaxID=22663 RepID=A0A218XY64_PUNGR|nr:uncharacterized protein LOC116199838 [Punica granatum]OWM89529.1 hypothetical protein CDL15_Pgr024277 [Punica granatum]PKI75477.1 hypothetical protein CRG98_004147 [Punica granatum]